MGFTQNTIGEIIEREKQMVLNGAQRYGDFFIVSSEFDNLLQHFVKSVDPDRYIFTMFLSQIRKHHLLALFSSLRLHHIQAMMNLRQVLEAGTLAAYAIANTDEKDFADIDENGMIEFSNKKLDKKRYRWLETHFKDGAGVIERMKKIINKSAAHANIVYAHHNFNFDSKEGKFITPFFDIEDDYLVKTDLWQIGNVAMGLMDLFYGVNMELSVIKFIDDFIPRLKQLEKKNLEQKFEMMNHERYKNIEKIKG